MWIVLLLWHFSSYILDSNTTSTFFFAFLSYIIAIFDIIRQIRFIIFADLRNIILKFSFMCIISSGFCRLFDSRLLFLECRTSIECTSGLILIFYTVMTIFAEVSKIALNSWRHVPLKICSFDFRINVTAFVNNFLCLAKDGSHFNRCSRQFCVRLLQVRLNHLSDQLCDITNLCIYFVRVFTHGLLIKIMLSIFVI